MRYQPLYEDPEYYPEEWEEAFPEPTEEEMKEILEDMSQERD
jgi:hypothetical protein